MKMKNINKILLFFKLNLFFIIIYEKTSIN